MGNIVLSFDKYFPKTSDVHCQSQLIKRMRENVNMQMFH